MSHAMNNNKKQDRADNGVGSVDWFCRAVAIAKTEENEAVGKGGDVGPMSDREKRAFWNGYWSAAHNIAHDLEALAQQAQPGALGLAKGSAAREIAAKLDGLLTVQINDRLGAGRWALVDLRGRLTRITDKDHTSEIWELDGKPILQTWPLKVEIVTEGHAIKLVVTQPYRTFSPNIAGQTRTAEPLKP